MEYTIIRESLHAHIFQLLLFPFSAGAGAGAGAGQFPQNPSRVLAIKHSTTNQSEVKTRLTYFGLFPPVLRGEVVEKLSR